MRLSLKRERIGKTGRLSSGSSDLDLVEALVASDKRLNQRFGPAFEEHLDEARTLILMTMARQGTSSPLFAAVELGVSGEFGVANGDDNDAFELLIQAALRLLFKTGTRETIN